MHVSISVTKMKRLAIDTSKCVLFEWHLDWKALILFKKNWLVVCIWEVGVGVA